MFFRSVGSSGSKPLSSSSSSQSLVKSSRWWSSSAKVLSFCDVFNHLHWHNSSCGIACLVTKNERVCFDPFFKTYFHFSQLTQVGRGHIYNISVMDKFNRWWSMLFHFWVLAVRTWLMLRRWHNTDALGGFRKTSATLKTLAALQVQEQRLLRHNET